MYCFMGADMCTCAGVCARIQHVCAVNGSIISCYWCRESEEVSEHTVPTSTRVLYTLL